MLRVVSLRLAAYACLAGFGVGGVMGGWGVYKIWDIAATNQKVKDLERQIEAKVAAENANNAQRKRDMEKIDALNKEIDDALGKIAPSICFDEHATDSVRQLWTPRSRTR